MGTMRDMTIRQFIELLEEIADESDNEDQTKVKVSFSVHDNNWSVGMSGINSDTAASVRLKSRREHA